MKRRIEACTVSLAAMMTFAGLGCGSFDDSPHSHSCDVVVTYGDWEELNLKLHHDDTRTCPVDATSGDTLWIDGTIEDGDYSGSGGGCCSFSSLSVYNSTASPHDCATNFNGDEVGGDFEGFGQTQLDADSTWEWASYLLSPYPAGTGTDPDIDCAVFEAYGVLVSAAATLELAITN